MAATSTSPARARTLAHLKRLATLAGATVAIVGEGTAETCGESVARAEGLGGADAGPEGGPEVIEVRPCPPGEELAHFYATVDAGVTEKVERCRPYLVVDPIPNPPRRSGCGCGKDPIDVARSR